ncbi:DUF1376 domain-containing protein [Ensifer sp. OV372]|uniref:YdaU family protein n=1 Tax=Ensifer sp. OV372 TaxID=1855293 RepID=UPI0008F370E7|nr:DUF1376 domain-containing protein [Ensifer sp. OV372]SFH52820.1 Uncharacterized conserved protein YdaU, DUF1376 family [Ensifer sp. OV372]
MSNRAWMPLHIADYLADTGHLTATEHGAYMLLIMHYWQNGALPENERVIARIAKLSPEQWEESRDMLAMLFGPGWTHKRIDAELAKADDIIEKRRSAASSRHSKSKSNASAEQMQSTCSDTRVPPLTDNLSTSSLRSDVCPEPEKSAPASPTAIELPALKGDMVSITEADVAEWSEAFPAVNVRQQLAAMRSWLNANPQNRKTSKGMKRFVVSWLSRDQDRGGGRQQPQAQAPPRPMSPHMQRQHDIRQKLERDLYGEPDDQYAGQTVDLGAGDFRSH